MAVVGDPLHSLRPLREEEINQLSSNRAQHGTHPLAYDVYRAGDQLVIEFDAPGAAPSDLAVAIEGRTIVVSLHRKLAHGAGIDVIEAGREHGSFQQRLWLGEGWDLERLHARSENGVLYVHGQSLPGSQPGRWRWPQALARRSGAQGRPSRTRRRKQATPTPSPAAQGIARSTPRPMPVEGAPPLARRSSIRPGRRSKGTSRPTAPRRDSRRSSAGGSGAGPARSGFPRRSWPSGSDCPGR